MVVAWFAEHHETLPEPVRRFLAEPLAKLRAAGVSQKNFNLYTRQLARALGLIASSERRRPSGRPLKGVKLLGGRRPHDERERLEHERSQLAAQIRRDRSVQRRRRDRLKHLDRELKHMDDNPYANPKIVELINRPIAEVELTQQDHAEIAEEAIAFQARLDQGAGAEPALQSSTETLMNADVVCTDEEHVRVAAELPEGVDESDIVKTLVEPRTRYDFAVTVTRIELDVEKKVVVTKDGQRRVFAASVSEYGPKGFAVTWQALATLAVLIGQFALPLNRLGTMLSTATKKFTATSLSRMAHYVAERFAPIYLVLMEQLADSEILAGDDTSCRVLEVSSFYKSAEHERGESPPWADYRTMEDANRAYLDFIKRKLELITRRADGDREAKKTAALDPPLKVLIGRELAFESRRRNGNGPKQALNTTVVTGRTDADDPHSLIVFYRSHLGSLGNLLEILLSKRKSSAKKLVVQADLSTTNLVTDPTLTSRFDIELIGCSAHARRPFAQYEDQDRLYAPYILDLFRELALHEHALDRFGRNRDNTLAVRGADSRRLWETIKELAIAMTKRWTKATPLGSAARYIITHYERLTAYLSNPRLEATNNLRERMLRTEKLIEKSSMFRRSIEGRVVLDILRTMLQTAVAAGVPPHEYLVSVMKADPDDIEEHPERYTPTAWAKRQAAV
jgi:hypothetical protein